MKIKIFALILMSPTTVWGMSLSDVLQNADAYSPEIESDQFVIEAAKEKLRNRQGAWRPKVSLDVDTGWARTDNRTTRTRDSRAEGDRRSVDLWETTSTLTVVQPFYNAGKLNADIAEQKFKYEEETIELLNTKQDMRSSTLIAYIDAQTSQQLEKLAKRNVNMHQIFIAQMKERLKYRIGTTAEVAQAQSRLYQSQDRLITAKHDVDQAYKGLNRFLSEAVKKLPDDEVYVDYKKTEENFMTDVHLYNYDSVALLSRIEGARQKAKSAEAAFYPEMSLDLEGVRDRHTSGSKGSTSELRATVNLSYDFYNGGRDLATYKERQALISVQKQRHRETALNNEADAYEIWRRLSLQKDRKTIIQKETEVLGRVLSDYKEEFKLGKRTLLDVLNTENELFFNQIELVRIKGSILCSHIDLLKISAQLNAWVDDFISTQSKLNKDNATSSGV